MTRGVAPSLRADGGRLRRLGLRVAGRTAGPARDLGRPRPPGPRLDDARGARGRRRRGDLRDRAELVAAAGDDRPEPRRREPRPRRGDGPGRRRRQGEAGPLAAGGRTGPAGAAGAGTRPTITSAIAGHADTAHSVAIGQLDVNVPGMAAMPFVGYQGDTNWLGYALIEGRWFAGPGEAVAPTNFFTRSGLHVGDTTTLDRRRTLDHGHARRRDLRHAARERRQPRPARAVVGPRGARPVDPAGPLGGAARGRHRRPGLPLLAPGRDRAGARACSSRGTRPGTPRSCCSCRSSACWASCSSRCRSAACSTRCCSRRASGPARWPCSRRSA